MCAHPNDQSFRSLVNCAGLGQDADPPFHAVPGITMVLAVIRVICLFLYAEESGS